MAQIIREIRVDVSQPNVFQAIVAKQLDCNSRFLKITLVDFGVKIEVPKTAKVTINANRPDGKSQSFMGVANNDGTITVPLAQWMLEVAGELKCDVSVINTTDNKRLTSTDFYVNVQEAANKSTDISENPDGEIRVITPTQKIDENSSDNEYPSAKAVYDLDNITATATGNAITVDSSEAPLQNLKLYGKTTQDGTLGENILPYPYTAKTQTINGVTFTDLGDGRIQVSGTASADTTYEFLKNATIDGLVVGRTYRVTGCNYFATNINFGMSFSQTSGPTREFILLNGEEFTAVATGITGLTATLSVLAGQTINTTIHPKLEVASVDLVSVGDSGSFRTDIFGKNFLNVTATTQTMNGITFTVNADKSVTVTGTATAMTSLFLTTNIKSDLIVGQSYIFTGGNAVYVIYNDGTMDYFGAWSAFTVTSDMKQIRPYIQVNSGDTVNQTYYPFIRPASIEYTGYEPYKTKQSITFTDTLRSVPNTTIKDVKDFTIGKTTKKVHQFTFNGSEEWEALSNGRVAIIVDSKYSPNVDLNGLYMSAKAICNRFQVVSWANLATSENAVAFGNSANIGFKVGEYTASVDAWKTYLASNPVTVVYEIKAQIETDITETELNAYRHLMTNKGNTTFISDADMEISYYVNKPNAQAIGSLHEQINKDYFKLQQAIISTGGSTL